MIITKQFLATYSGPQRLSGFKWVWVKRAGAEVEYVLVFLPRERRFEANRYVKQTLHGRWATCLSARDVHKLRALLPPEAIAECMAASINPSSPERSSP